MTIRQIPYGVIFIANDKIRKHQDNINIKYQYPICINFILKYRVLKLWIPFIK